MKFWQKIQVVWQSVGVMQRALLVATVLSFVLICGLLAYWAQRPDMKVLYSGLDPEEAGKITDKISEQDIPYKLSNSGTTIYAPKKNVAQLRLDMAKEGLPGDSQKGYGIFDEEKIGISPFVQNVNLKRALQNELARSIQMIDGIDHARIHIVTPESTLFAKQQDLTSASIVLRIKPGYRITALNISAITHIVAGSVEGLSAEKVTVIDSQGRLLSDESDAGAGRGAGTVADYRERVEQNLADKVEDMLVAVLGPGRAMVKISADIDMTSSNTAKEIYDESKKVPSKEEIKSESETGGGSGQAKKGETILTEYSVPKTVQQTVELPGEILSLTVAAFVDLSVPVKEKIEGEEEAAAETVQAGQKIMEMAEVEEIIKRAVGPKLAENGLKVVDVKFNRPAESLIDTQQEAGLDFVAIAKQGSLGIMAVCALVVLKMFSGAKKKAGTAGADFDIAQISSGGTSGNSAEAGDAVSESLLLRKQISKSLKRNPEQVKQLFASWLDDKGVA
ncbi:MAG: flagellar M-ring protein FliF [Anaerohalosphaeraceae bacterium]|nr:flagellar M-ring protein FliF [Anaerohalosphaeraceae bacterium]